MLFALFVFQPSNSLDNTSWVYPVGKSADTLKFEADHAVIEYDCEMNYTFRSTYRISKDTVIIDRKDDSHPEDGGKVLYSRDFYLLRGNSLNLIRSEERLKGKWVINHSIKKGQVKYQRLVKTNAHS